MDAKKTNSSTNGRKAQGFCLLEQGKKSQAKIARSLSVSEAAVCVWNKKLKKHGKESLALKKATGRPAGLMPANKVTVYLKRERREINPCALLHNLIWC